MRLEDYMRLSHLINVRCMRRIVALVAHAAEDKQRIFNKIAISCVRKQKRRYGRILPNTSAYIVRISKRIRLRNTMDTRRRFMRDLKAVMNDIAYDG